MLTLFKEICKTIMMTCSDSEIIALQRHELTNLARKGFALPDEQIRIVYEEVFGYSVKLK